MNDRETTNDLAAETRRCAAMAAACKQLKALSPPCWRYAHHGPASHIVEIDSELHAICSMCAQQIAIGRQVQRQKKARAAMRSGGQ